MSRFDPRNQRPRPQRERPRRVSGGVRAASVEVDQTHWASQRWRRLLDEGSSGDRLREGLEYASSGQTRSISVEPGAIVASVQGRRARPYSVTLSVPSIDVDQWERVTEGLLGEPALAARLLANELPRNIEDVFAPLRLALFPNSLSDVTPSCDCDDGAPWCKHACCAMRLAADLFDAAPLLIFQLRGMDAERLMDQLRRRRAAQGSAVGFTPAYAQRVAPDNAEAAEPLEACLDDFWEAGESLESIDATPEPPQVTCALLKRMGPTPFEQARFPLVGLLATCYEEIGAAALRDASSGEEPASDADGEPTPVD